MDSQPTLVSVDAVGWDGVLRAYASTLDELRAFLLSTGREGLAEGTDLLPMPFQPPAGFPPCPPELLGRLLSLDAETEGLIAYASSLIEDFRPLMSAQRATGSTPDRASAIDTRL
jgi:hypothetical protein